MKINKWHIITYFALLFGLCIGIYTHFNVMPNIVITTLDYKPLVDHKYVIGILDSKAKLIEANGVTNYKSGWEAIQNLWTLILSATLIILGISIPIARFCWQRAYKKLDSELNTVLCAENQLFQFAHIEKSMREQQELKKQSEQDFWNHPVIAQFNEVCGEKNDLINEMSAEIGEYKARIAKLEKHLVKVEGQLIRYKKKQDND